MLELSGVGTSKSSLASYLISSCLIIFFTAFTKLVTVFILISFILLALLGVQSNPLFHGPLQSPNKSGRLSKNPAKGTIYY